MLFDDAEGVTLVFPGQHLQVEGGDDRVRAGQEGQRCEVRGKGGRQEERLDKWSSLSYRLCPAFIFLSL